MSQNMPRQTTSPMDVGARLKQTREEKGITISAAAMQTNLRADIIEKLEVNDFSSIGAPVFTRGYLNIYARFLGLDEEEMAQAFATVKQERKDDTLRLNTANIESQNKPYRRSVARGWFSLILVLLIGGGLISQLLDNQSWLMQQIRGTFAQQDDTSNISADSTDSNSSDDNELETQGFTVEVAGERPQNDTELPQLTSIEGTPVDIPPVSQDESLPSTPELNSATLGSNGSDDTNDLATANENLPIVQPVETQRGAVLKTNQENWMQITNSNGKVLDSRIFKAGEEIQLPGDGAPYQLNIGRPNAVSLTVNGENKPLDSYRRKGQIRLFELSIP